MRSPEQLDAADVAAAQDNDGRAGVDMDDAEGMNTRLISTSPDSRTSGDQFFVSVGHFRNRTFVKPSA